MKRSEELVRTVPSSRLLERALHELDDQSQTLQEYREVLRDLRKQVGSVYDAGIDPQKLLGYANAAHMANQHTVTISSNTLAIIARALGAKDD